MAREGRGRALRGGQEANALLSSALKVAFDIHGGPSVGRD